MSKSRPHLLLVDDEASIREPLTKYLEKQGFRVSDAANAGAARSSLIAYDIDLVLLDIMMPGEDGLSLCRHIAATDGPPVILLTAKSEETADDYVVKPFSPRELVARIKVVLRRLQAGNRNHASESESYSFAGWTLKINEQALYDKDGILVSLSSGEFRMLEALIARAGQVLNRDQLLDLTRGREGGPFDRAIDNQISRLRRKIEDDAKDPQHIKTIWGGGYRFSTPVQRV
jgi:two-component system, OmpR family, response regulator